MRGADQYCVIFHLASLLKLEVALYIQQEGEYRDLIFFPFTLHSLLFKTRGQVTSKGEHC